MDSTTISKPQLRNLRTRAAVCICGLVVFLLTSAWLCGANRALFASVLLTDGAVAAAWIAGACALGAVVLQRLKLSVGGALFVASAGGLGLGIFSLLGLGLGLAGWLNQAVAISLPAASAIWWFAENHRRLHRSAVGRWLLEPAGASWLWLIPVVSLAIAMVSASMMPGILWKPLDPHPYDVTGYHLLVPREWYEGGRIVPLEHNVYSFFEFNVEMQFLLLMHAMGGPWAAMYACQFLCAGYTALMVVGVAGASNRNEHQEPACRIQDLKSKSDLPDLRSARLDVGRSTSAFSSTLCAALASTIPWVIMLAGVAYVESALMLYTALSIAWGLQAVRNPDRLMQSLMLSGVFAGLACGVKITAVPMLLLAVPTGVCAVLAIRRPPQLRIRRLMIGCAGVLLSGSVVLSPWLIRNLVWAGNPLFPVGMKALGKDHFDDVQVKRFHDAHSPTDAQQPFAAKANLLWRDVLFHWQFGYVLLPLGLFGCFARWRDRQTWLIFICGLFVLVVWIGFTHLLPRFLVMLVPIAAISVGRINWGRAWPAGVVLLLVAAGMGWSEVVPELLRQPAVIGVEDLGFMLSPELVAARDSKMQIGLVGDAQAFLYQIPLNRMHYRAVFNIHGGTDDPIQAWVGNQPLGDRNWLLVINPAEIKRLHATYYGVPGLRADWASRGSQPFFLRGDQDIKQ